MRIDPYKHKERYLKWKGVILRQGIKDLTKENSDKIINFVFDMEMGLNVASISAKGGRSYIHLNNLRQRMTFLTKQLELRNDKISLANLIEQVVFSLFTDMRTGQLKRVDGKTYISIRDYVKIFKSFWHWHMKASKKKGTLVEDITTDLDTSQEKPS